MLLEMYRSAEADCKRERGQRIEAQRQLREKEELLGLVQSQLDRVNEMHRMEVESHARTESRRFKAVEEGLVWKQWLDNADLDIMTKNTTLATYRSRNEELMRAFNDLNVLTDGLAHAVLSLHRPAIAQNQPLREGTPESPAF
jgi:hypothetical protein